MEVLSERAVLLEQLGDKEGALRDCTRVIILDPENAMSFGQRGRVRESLGDLRAALKDYKKARSLDPQCLTYEFLVRRLEEDLGLTSEGRCA